MKQLDPFETGDTGPLAGIGHNLGPSTAASSSGLVGRLEAAYEKVKGRWLHAIQAAAEVPNEITDDETARKATDLVGLMKACATELDRNREQEKEPYLSASRVVDQFFGGPKDKHQLMATARDIERRLGRWLSVKAAIERRAREEREAREREEANRRFAAAMAAQEAETAATTQAEAARQAAAAASADLDGAREAVAAAANEYRAARADHAAALGHQDADAATDAMNRMAVATAKGEAARARVHQLHEEAVQRDAAARRAADVQALAAAKVATALDEAAATEASAAKLAKEAAAPISELSRTRGDYAQSGLRRRWTFDAFDRNRIDLEALRAHLPQAGVEAAIRSYIAAGGRNLRGVSIYEETTAVVR